MIETGSDSEAILQELLARYLNLLAGDASGGCSFALATGQSRGSPQGSGWPQGTWAVDHLLLDDDAQLPFDHDR